MRNGNGRATSEDLCGRPSAFPIMPKPGDMEAQSIAPPHVLGMGAMNRPLQPEACSGLLVGRLIGAEAVGVGAARRCQEFGHQLHGQGRQQGRQFFG